MNLQQYIRLPKERQIELFKQAEPYLTLSETVKLDDSKEVEELKNKLEKYTVFEEIIDKIDQPKLESLMKNTTLNPKLEH